MKTGTTYEQDLAKAVLDLARWKRKLTLARTKCRKLKARCARLSKHVTSGTQKKKRRSNFPLHHAVPVVAPEL